MKTTLLSLYAIAVMAFGTAPVFAQCKPEKETDTCDVNALRIIDGSYAFNDAKTAVGIWFSLKLNTAKGATQSVYALVTLTNCKNETITVKVPFFYDAKADVWVGKQSVAQNSECPFKVTDYQFILTNPCGEEFSTMDQAKAGNGRQLKELESSGKLPARDRIVARRRRGQ
jgi:hypothetical protein